MPPLIRCRSVWLGNIDYLAARDLQLALVEKVHSGEKPNTLLLLEHPHVYTKGRLSKPSDVLLPEEELAAKGVPVHETDRGGQVTYRGPGQLVVYPIVNLKDWGGPVKYVRALEQVIIATLAEMGYNVDCFCYQDSPRRAHSVAAQGGINAAKNYRNDGDSIFRLFYDTVKGGDYRAREAHVYRLAQISNNIPFNAFWRKLFLRNFDVWTFLHSLVG